MHPVQTEGVAHTALFAIETLILGGGLVPVHVDREADIAVEFGEVGQTVGIRGRDQPQDRFAHVLKNLAATGAVEAGEVVGELGSGLQAGAVLLQKGAATGRLLQDPEDAGPDPKIVGYLGAGTGMRGGVGKSGDGLEEGVVHGDGGGVRNS